MTDIHDPPAISNRSSIDLSLELEQQLDSESLPPDSPGFPRGLDGNNRTSLDPHVLAHIVTQLRDSVTQITRERDDLVQRLAESHSREAEFKDSQALSTERCAVLEKDLESSRKKNQDDEEAISMLRSKVEESRRGLMRLQSERSAENKRMTLDLTNARTPSFGGAPRSSNRASFTPLTGSGHPGPPSSFRRSTSSTSNTSAEIDPGFAEFVAGLPGSPGQTLVFNDNAENNSIPSNRRRSMFAPGRSSNHLESRSSPSALELDSLKQELASARTELEETRHELSESNEAREASETCVQALRDYIASVGAGDASGSEQNVRLPPLPSELHVKDLEPAPKPKSSGWGGLKLWRVDTGASAPSTASTSHISPVAGRQSMDSYRTVGSEHESSSPSTAVPLRNKFGAFFARGTSISSIPHPPPQSHQEEPILNGSDVSSSTEERSEPTSPVIERVQPVFVRDAISEVAEGPTEDTGGSKSEYTPHDVDDNDTMKVVPHPEHDTMKAVPL